MRSKHLLLLSALTGVIFIAISAVSFFVLTDGHGVVVVHDGIKRIGWPWLMFEEGGYAWVREFYPKAALANLAFSACVAAFLLIAGGVVRGHGLFGKRDS